MSAEEKAEANAKAREASAAQYNNHHPYFITFSFLTLYNTDHPERHTYER